MDFKNGRLMMSEEEARNRAKELLNENQVDLLTKYMFLEQQCKKQKEVIDKAREIISKEFLCYDNESDEYIQGVKLLDILKEVE